MFFRRKKEFSEEEIEKIIEDYGKMIKSLLKEHLPRWARRAMNKTKNRTGVAVSKKGEEIRKIKKMGMSSWLEQTTQELFEELSSFTTDPASLKSKLDTMLKEFKRKWKIK